MYEFIRVFYYRTRERTAALPADSVPAGDGSGVESGTARPRRAGNERGSPVPETRKNQPKAGNLKYKNVVGHGTLNRDSAQEAHRNLTTQRCSSRLDCLRRLRRAF